MNLFKILSLFSVMFFFSCDPKDDPIECLPDSVNSLDGIIYNGHITLCNAQGSSLVYEPGVCSVFVKSDSIIFSLFSTDPSFNYYYRDTLTSNCSVIEERQRVFHFYEFSSSEIMGYAEENNENFHLIIKDNVCPTSSLFEGD